MTQLGLFIAGAAAATAVNAALFSYQQYSSQPDAQGNRKLTKQHVQNGATLALALDAAVIAPVLTGAAALQACRSR